MSFSFGELKSYIDPLFGRMRSIELLVREAVSVIRDIPSQLTDLANQGRSIMTTQADIVNALTAAHDREVSASAAIADRDAKIAQLNATVASLTSKNDSLTAANAALQTQTTGEFDPNSVQDQLAALAKSGSDLDAAVAGTSPTAPSSTAPLDPSSPTPVIPSDPVTPVVSPVPDTVAGAISTPQTPAQTVTTATPAGAPVSAEPVSGSTVVPDISVTGTPAAASDADGSTHVTLGTAPNPSV